MGHTCPVAQTDKTAPDEIDLDKNAPQPFVQDVAPDAAQGNYGRTGPLTT